MGTFTAQRIEGVQQREPATCVTIGRWRNGLLLLFLFQRSKRPKDGKKPKEQRVEEFIPPVVSLDPPGSNIGLPYSCETETQSRADVDDHPEPTLSSLPLGAGSRRPDGLVRTRSSARGRPHEGHPGERRPAGQSRWDEPMPKGNQSVGRPSAEFMSSRQSIRPSQAGHRQENVYIPPVPEQFFSQSPMNRQETDRHSEESASMSQASSSLAIQGPTDIELAAFKAGQRSVKEAIEKANLRDMELLTRKDKLPRLEVRHTIDQQSPGLLNKGSLWVITRLRRRLVTQTV